MFACQTRPPFSLADVTPINLPDGALLIADVRLDERAPLAASLGLARTPADDAELAAAACVRWGDAAIEHLYGDAALAHWDPRTRRLTLARDAVGVRSLYYFHDGALVLFASSLPVLLNHPLVPRAIDELGIANVLTLGVDEAERTLHQHIRRVPPGGRVRFSPLGRTVERWWTLDRIAPQRFARDEDYVEAGRTLLDNAVASRLPRTGRIATMLSGGFDSTAVTATAARLLGERGLVAFTRVAGAPHPYGGLDERAHAGAVAALYPRIDWRVIDDPPEAEPAFSVEREAAAQGQLQLASYNVAWFDPVHREVERIGAQVLLVGNLGNMTLSWGGDTLVAEQLAAGHWGAAMRTLVETARHRQMGPAELARRYLWPTLEPRSLRRWRLARRQGGSVWRGHSMVSAAFLEDIDYARHAESYGHDLPFHMGDSGRAARMRALQRQPGRDSDDFFRRKRRFTKLDPFQDRRLIEFTLGVPEEQFLRRGESRSLARRVLADRLPPALLAENQRGRQSPEWFAFAERRRPFMLAALDDIARSPLASRVLDVPRMRALLEAWPKDASAAKANELLIGGSLYRAINTGIWLRQWEGTNA